MLWGNNYEKPITAAYKTIRIINDVSFQDHITPHYVNLVLLKFRDVVKVYTCLFLYDHLCDKKPCNFSTRTSTSLQLFLPYLRTNIRKFCPRKNIKKILSFRLLVNIFGMIFLFPFEILLRKFFFILLISNLLN